jgi:hypothetical protein
MSALPPVVDLDASSGTFGSRLDAEAHQELGLPAGATRSEFVAEEERARSLRRGRRGGVQLRLSLAHAAAAQAQRGMSSSASYNAATEGDAAGSASAAVARAAAAGPPMGATIRALIADENFVPAFTARSLGEHLLIPMRGYAGSVTRGGSGSGWCRGG